MSENSVTEEMGEGGSISKENRNFVFVISGEPTGGAAGIANGDDDDGSNNLETIYQQIAKDNPNSENGQEDAAKEEFTDCAEEIEASGSQQILMGNDNGIRELNNGTPVRNLTVEMESIRKQLDQPFAREAFVGLTE